MASITEHTVKLKADTQQYEAALKKAQKTTSMWSGQMGTLFKGMTGMFAGAFSIGAIINFTKQSIQAFNEAEQAASNLKIALKGDTEAFQRLNDFASTMQQRTLFDDDAVVQAMAFMRQLQLTEAQIKILIPLVADFATAQKIDLSEAAKLVGKSVMGSATALKKMGFEIEGTAGSAERFTSVINTLTTAVEGQAEAAAKVGTGPMRQFWNNMANVFEGFGGFWTRAGNAYGELFNAAIFGVSPVKKATEEMSAGLKKFVEDFVAANSAVKDNRSQLQMLQDELEDLEESFDGSWDINKIAAYNDQVEILKNKIKDIKEITTADLWMKSKGETLPIPKSGGKLPMTYPGQSNQLITQLSILKELPKELSKIEQFYQEWNARFTDMVKYSLVEFTTILAEGIGEAAITGNWKSLFETLLNLLSDFMMQFGQMMVAMGIQMAIFESSMASLNPAGMIAAGATLMVIAGAMRALLKEGIFGNTEKMADGGIVFGPTLALVGEYSGANRNPEVVAPLSDLQKMIGGSQDVTVRGRLYGSDILISNERTSYQRQRIRGF